MESIKTYLLPLFLTICFSTPIFSQNDFNENINEKNKEELIDLKTDSILVHTYFTERDYNEKYNIETVKHDNGSELYNDEAYNDKEQRRKVRDDFFIEVAAEVIVEVVINAIFIIAAIW